MISSNKQLYEFGEFRLDPHRRRLLRNGEVVPVPPKALEALSVLVRNPSRLLEREELMQAVWAETFVEDANLTVAISQLRKVLGQNGEKAEFIETIPRVGYRFVADVRTIDDVPLVVEKHTVSRTVIEEELIPSDTKSEAAALPHNTSALPTPSGSSRAIGQRQLLILAAVAATVLISLVIYLRLPQRPTLPPTTGQVKSMAVLPFRPLTVKPEDEYIRLGLADALITQLGTIREVTIRPLSAVLKYDKEEDPLAIGRALGVEAVLDGTLLHEGDNVRVTMRMLRVGDGVMLWSGTFDEKFTDIFAMQDSISQQVAQAAVLNLSREDRQRLTKRYTSNLEAYHLYLKGRYFWNKRTADGILQSFDYFKKAIDIDPAFAVAYAGLADAYALGVWQDSLPQKEYIPLAKAAALSALQIDDTVGEAHASLGFVRFWYEWDFKGAEAAFQRAIELSPNNATAHHWYGEFLVLMGRSEEGFKELKLAQDADPLSLIINSDLGKMYFFTRQSDHAIHQLKKTIEMDPQFPVAHLFLALAYKQKGMMTDAIAELEREEHVPSSRAVFKFVLAYFYAETGRRAEALRILDELQEPRPGRFAPAYGIALIHVGLNQKDEAFTWLEKSRMDREPFLRYIKVDPNFDKLRDDRRFSEFLTQVGFQG